MLNGQRPIETWGLKNDSDLILGCYKHGIGNWFEFYKDKELIFYDENPNDIQGSKLTERIRLLVIWMQRFLNQDLRW